MAKNSKLFAVCSAAGTAIATLALALRGPDCSDMVTVVFHPVSEAGREGIEELETQTSQLLSFQSIGTPVFGTQAAFNLLPRYGTESRQDLHTRLLQIRAEISGALGNAAGRREDCRQLGARARILRDDVQRLRGFGREDRIRPGLSTPARTPGFTLVPATEAAPSNVSVAGETSIFLRAPEADSSRPGGWWFWGAADNLRLPAWSGCKLAEWLEE